MFLSIILFAYAMLFFAAGILLDRVVFLPLEAQIREQTEVPQRCLTDRGEEAAPSVPAHAHLTDQNTSVKENS